MAEPDLESRPDPEQHWDQFKLSKHSDKQINCSGTYAGTVPVILLSTVRIVPYQTTSTEPERDKISYNMVPYGTGTSITASFLQK